MLSTWLQVQCKQDEFADVLAISRINELNSVKVIPVLVAPKMTVNLSTFLCVSNHRTALFSGLSFTQQILEYAAYSIYGDQDDLNVKF